MAVSIRALLQKYFSMTNKFVCAVQHRPKILFLREGLQPKAEAETLDERSETALTDYLRLCLYRCGLRQPIGRRRNRRCIEASHGGRLSGLMAADHTALVLLAIQGRRKLALA